MIRVLLLAHLILFSQQLLTFSFGLPKADEVDLTAKLTDEKLLELGSHCRSQHPRVIFYNRVPKCGSTTTNRYIAKNSRVNSKTKFNLTIYCDINVKDHPETNPYVMYPGEEERKFRSEEMMQKNKFILSTHTVFYPYLHPNTMKRLDGQGRISYFNIIREPYERNISLWNYMGTCHTPNCEGYRTQFMDSRVPNPIIRYFCGFQKECMAGGQDALYIAKVQAVRTYSFVGLMERMSETLAILKKTYPDFFHLKYSGTKKNQNQDRNPQYEVEKIDFIPRNSLDYEFYSFVVKLFDRKVAACFGPAV